MPPPIGSMRITSAPICAIVMPPSGAATKAEISTIRRSCNKRFMTLHPEAGNLDRRASVHDDLKPMGLGAGGGVIIADAELHPNDLGADGDRLIDYAACHFAPAKHIDHVDRLRHIGELRVDGLAIDRAPGCVGVYRDRPVAAPLEIGHHAVARALMSRARADDGNRAHTCQDVAEIRVRIFVVVHFAPHRSCQTGARFSRKASMPSPASSASMLVVMTSAAYR